jgi:hypothetical protein
MTTTTQSISKVVLDTTESSAGKNNPAAHDVGCLLLSLFDNLDKLNTGLIRIDYYLKEKYLNER